MKALVSLPFVNQVKNKILYSHLPNIIMNLMDNYLRVEIEGLENIPQSGPVIILPNHSGYAGLDAMVLSHTIFKHKNRVARVLTHYLWFTSEITTKIGHKLGFVEATKDNGLKQLLNNHLIILFPEGERGNFKPTKYAYQLQEFKRGFVRMGLKSKATIVPTIIIGAEETHINLKKLKLGKFINNLSLPLPANLLPLPVKWKIVFMEGIYLPYDAEKENDTSLVHNIASLIQDKMQKQIEIELENRPGIFIERPDWLQNLFNMFNLKI